MALIDLKSDLSKFRSDFQTPTLENTVNASKYNIDDKPNFKTSTLETKINVSKYNIDELPKKFGANGAKPSKLDAFDYKKEIAMNNSKFAIGTATLSNQLGTGSPFKYLKDGALTSKIFSKKGYSSTNTYNSVVASISDQPNKSLLYKKGTEQNSPSAIDAEYKKYSLRDDAYNPTYMRHPLIVRGIQRKGNEKPQYWGFGSKSGFDDGLIRGGIVTVADRIVADTVRIAKFMASPKGLLWIVKQIGLGLTNPKVEAIGGFLTRQTRIHTGVASLLSVPGTALGLHFTRHGIPFANEIASYENVIKFKQNPLTGNTKYSRLGLLMDEFGVTLPKTVFEEGARFIKVVKSKTILNSLSGLAGPGSVYGIGTTSIRRVVDTVTDAKANAETLKFYSAYHGSAQYASGVSNSDFKSAKAFGELNKNTAATVDELKLPPVPNPEKRESLKNKLSNIGATATPGAKLNSTPVDLSTTKTRTNVYKSAPVTDINSYVTLAYGKIPKNKGESSFRDFRSDIDNSIDSRNAIEAGILGTGVLENYYKDNNLETRYGFGKLGSVGADKLNALGKGSFLIAGNTFNRNTSDRKILLTDKFRGDKVTALDISSEKTILATDAVYPAGAEDLIKFYFEDGDQGRNVMPFRCTLTGFSDSFSPGWDKIDIMGRPDGAYLYSSFERAISFSFIVAALSRSEMIPMWRKLNYLASYTMPDFNAGTKPSGPFMRITIGDMFQRTPGFITSLTYNIPDDATWDTASDAATNKDAKQLPMMIEANVSFTIVSDYRPQMMGRVYSLSVGGKKDKTAEGQWLADAET